MFKPAAQEAVDGLPVHGSKQIVSECPSAEAVGNVIELVQTMCLDAELYQP